MERAVKRDHRGAPGRVARQLDGRLDGLGAGVGQEDALLGLARGEPAQPFAERGHALEIEVRAADVEEAIGRVLHRGDDLGMPVAGG